MEENNEFLKEPKPNQAVKGEKEPLGPKISINIVYGPHLTGIDVEPLRKQFNEVDVFVPEMFGWTPQLLEGLRRVSGGRAKPGDLVKELKLSPLSLDINTFFLGELRTLYKSSKKVMIIDVPDGHPLIERMKDFDRGQLLPIEPLVETFRGICNSVRYRLRELTEIRREREAYMLSQLPSKIQELLNLYPALRKKEEIKLLLRLGTAHFGVYRNLREMGFAVTPRMPEAYTFQVEGAMLCASEKEIDDQLAARIYLENKFRQTFRKDLNLITENTEKTDLWIKKIVSQFSIEEAEEIFFTVVKRKDIEPVFETYLSKKKLSFPESEKEIDELLTIPLSVHPNPPEQN